MGLRGRSRFGNEGHTLFITTTVVNFAKVFGRDETYFEILADSLKHQLGEHRTKLIAFVFMPSHIHFVAMLPAGESISDFMRDFKKFTSTKIRQQLERDHNIHFLKILRRNAKAKSHHVFKLWMDRFDDFIVDNDKTLLTKIDYIHHNPVKAGLVVCPEDWKYSSAVDYEDRKDGPLPVFTEWYND